MLNKVIISAALATGFALATTAAQAATLSVIGGADVALPGNFSLVGTPVYDTYQGGVGDIGDTIKVFDQASKTAANGLTLDGPASISFRFLGSEAGFQNVALVMGTNFVNNKVDAPGSVSSSFTAGAGFIPFSFVSLGVNTIANAGIANANLRLSFSEVFNGGASILALFDDNDPDVDHDDLVVRIDVTPVPLPAAGWMLLAGLAGMGLLGRKRRAA